MSRAASKVVPVNLDALSQMHGSQISNIRATEQAEAVSQ